MSCGPRVDGREWSIALDVVIATVFAGLIQIELWVFGPETELELWATIAASVVGFVTAASVAGRTLAPVPAFAINAVTLFVLVGIGYESNFYQWTNLLLLYAVAQARRDATSLVALGVALLGVAYYFTALPIDDVMLGMLVALLWTLVWVTGRMVATRRSEHTMRADRDLAEALAATNRERLELQSKRADMARELHDLIGHTVNVMVVHAGAARLAIREDPEAAERALTTIEATGRDALEELDRVLGVLRAESGGAGAPTAPAPDLSSLPDLADQFGSAGLATSIEVTGPLGRVPSSVALSVYRIIQESLTNTLKHAGATAATARVSIDERWVRVTVEDDGRSTGVAPGTRAGRGLRGISERAEMHGGSAEYGPRATGGFLVACALPLTAAT